MIDRSGEFPSGINFAFPERKIERRISILQRFETSAVNHRRRGNYLADKNSALCAKWNPRTLLRVTEPDIFAFERVFRRAGIPTADHRFLFA
jgi:hypothetical protein